MKYQCTFLFIFLSGFLQAQPDSFSTTTDSCLVMIASGKINSTGKSSFQIKGRLELKLHRMYYGDTAYQQNLGNRETDEALTQNLIDWSNLCESEAIASCKMAEDSAFYQDSIDMNYFRFTSEKDTIGELITLQIKTEEWSAYPDYFESHYNNYVFYPAGRRTLTYEDLVDSTHEPVLAAYACKAYADQLIDMEYSEEDKRLMADECTKDSYNFLNNFMLTDTSVIFYFPFEIDYFSTEYTVEVNITDFHSCFNERFRKLSGH